MSSQYFPKLGSSHRGISMFSVCSWNSVSECEYTTTNLMHLIKPTIGPTKEEDFSNYTQDKLDVVKLPAIVEKPNKPSTRLERYRKRREREYEEVIDEMKRQMEYENIQVADKIRCQSDFIKNKIRSTDSQMAHLVRTTGFDKNKTLNITLAQFQDICNNLYNLQAIKRCKIRYYYNFLKDIEMKRTAAFKVILRNTFQHLLRRSHKPPHQIESFIENQIHTINGVTMSNLRHYSDLTYHLLSTSENTMYDFVHELQMNKEKWLKYNAAMTIMRLNKEKLQKNYMETFDRETMGIFQNINTINDEFNLSYTTLPILYLSQDEYESFEYDVRSYLNEISDQTTKIIGIFRMTINNVFFGYFESWENLKRHMIERGELTEFDLQTIKAQYMVPAIERADKKFKVKLDELNENLLGVQEKLKARLNDALDFLKNSTQTWNNYKQNVERASYLIVVEMVLKIMSNDKIMKGFRVQLNQLLDELRQAPTKEKLDISLTMIINFLDKMRNQYKKNGNSEEAVLYKYRNYINNIIDVLILQFEEIISYKSDEMELLSTQMRPRASQILVTDEEAECEEDATVCSAEIKMCEYQLDALSNWYHGLRGILISYIKTCRDELIETAENWIENIKTRNNTRIGIQLTSLNVLYEQIKEDIYDVRKMELYVHRQVLSNHIADVENVFDQLSNRYGKTETKHKEAYEKVKNDFKELAENASKVTKATDVELCCIHLNQVAKSYEEQYESLISGLSIDGEMLYYKILKSGHTLRKSIKLFPDGGNFHSEEIKDFLNELKAAETKTTKRFRTFATECKNKLKRYKIDFDKVHSDTDKKLTAIRSEFTMRDNTVVTIKKLQYEIRKKAYEFKYDYKKLLACYKEFFGRCDSFLGKPESLAEIRRTIEEIIEHTEEFSKELLIPEDILNESVNILMGLNATDNERDENGLYEKPPSKIGKSFMSDVVNKIFATYTTIRSDAQVFYDNKPVVANESKLKSNFGDFMTEIVDRFKYYHVQCEPLWTEQTKGFIQLLTEFEVFMNKYKDNFCDTFKEKHFEKAASLKLEAKCMIKNVTSTNYEKFKKIHNQLKPLHGHPNNKHLLKEIDDKMNEELFHLVAKLREELDPLKDEYYANRDYFHQTFPVIEDELKDIVSTLEYNKKYEDIFRTFEQKVQLLTKLMVDDEKSGCLIKSSMSDVCSQIWNKIGINAPNSSDRLTASLSSETSLCCLTSSYKSVEMLNVSYYLEEYDYALNKFLREVEMLLNSLQAEMEEWEKIWQADIDRIHKLYSVKYDIKKE